ncbi:IscS subfamily cysteine desulfurase [Candidatus Ishikawella capsulata]|uniref:cysteine desulfurase n=1 Tax=Candidatus Ishikawaella capsulata Mpkobe TaxID=476281 RepID=C5WC79_9ENTR|nr:IscS subfamily cysteine desulfurase [Candidatus Ishikawaella capsulata]BAH82935.1 cysteine desulfurase [Candidatus Ishikawaella capsulata Mpkobe]
MKLPIYLDYAATTPIDPRVVHKMMQYFTLDGNFGNPSSRSHRFGWQAEEAVEIARNQIADLLNADSREIIFTSGATESNNLAIKGIAYSNQTKGKHIITSKTEHKAVLDTCRQLELDGFEIDYLTPQNNGLVNIKTLESTIRDDTILISIMHVNNEIGVIQDLNTISKCCYDNNIIFHVDAAQSAGKVPIDLQQLKVDLMSLSAHKVYGPKGIGALYINRQLLIKIKPQMHGGGQERGIRSGTLPVHQIVGMGEAYFIAKLEMHSEMKRIIILRDKLWDGVNQRDDIKINGNLLHNVGNILNLSFTNIQHEQLIILLKKVAISSGSACNSATLEPSYVLRTLGVPIDLALNSFRFSLGRFTSEAEIDYTIALINNKLNAK